MIIADDAWPDAVVDIERVLARSGLPSTLGSCKFFEGRPRQLWFTGDGICLTIDTPAVPEAVDLFRALDRVALDYRASVNLSKDSRLDSSTVAALFPDYDMFRSELEAFDPKRRFDTALRRRARLVSRDRAASGSCDRSERRGAVARWSIRSHAAGVMSFFAARDRRDLVAIASDVEARYAVQAIPLELDLLGSDAALDDFYERCRLKAASIDVVLVPAGIVDDADDGISDSTTTDAIVATNFLAVAKLCGRFLTDFEQAQ